MCDLIYDVINHCAEICKWVKRAGVYDKIEIKNLKRKKMKIK